MHDSLGDRMKGHYENRTRYLLPRRTFTVIRVDGKAFHTLTQGCERPFDTNLMATMDATAKAMCEGIQGARLAFVQSDEISVILTDFETPTTDAWFDGNTQKIASISASIATGAFNQERLLRLAGDWQVKGFGTYSPLQQLAALQLAHFDSRVFTIPDRDEVLNYLLWRQQDATRNSIQMVAQAHFSAKELHGKSCNELQELLFTEKGVNWNDYPASCKRGRLVVQRTSEKDVEYVDKRTQETRRVEGVKRREWCVEKPPVFTADRAWADAWLPRQIPNRES